MTSDAFLTLENLTKRFGALTAVAEVTMSVEQGDILALLGPSGSGKTTTLRLLGGFESPDSGSVVVGGRDVTQLSPAERRFGMVFQHYALFPHLSVGENVGFGLDRLDKSARAGRVVEVLRQVDLAGFESRDVTELSGGQQQRVAVARALAPQPEVLLLDEPLSNLDPTLRERTRMELRDSLKSIGITTVFVTHEQEEAFALGDQIAVLRDGRLEQTGTATDLYEQPRTRFVATFVGRASVLQGVMTGPAQATTGANVVWPVRPTTTLVQGQRVDLVCRPEALRFTDDEGLPGVVVHRRFTGARAYFGVTTDLGEVEVESSAHAAQEGDTVRVAAEFVHAFPSTG